MSTKRLFCIFSIVIFVGITTLIAAQDNGESARPAVSQQARSRRSRFMTDTERGAFMIQPPLTKDDAEKTILAVLDDLDRNQRRGNMNISVEDGRLLRVLTETMGAKTVVEIGTSNGYSGIWFCLALQSTGGKLITHEIDEGRASLARENFKRAGVESLVTLVMGDAHETVTRLEGLIDIVFIDADKAGYVDYLEKLLPLVRPGGLIIAHNMMPGMADPGYVNAITTNPVLETILLHRETTGVSVTLKKR